MWEEEEKKGRRLVAVMNCGGGSEGADGERGEEKIERGARYKPGK